MQILILVFSLARMSISSSSHFRYPSRANGWWW